MTSEKKYKVKFIGGVDFDLSVLEERRNDSKRPQKIWETTEFLAGYKKDNLTLMPNKDPNVQKKFDAILFQR